MSGDVAPSSSGGGGGGAGGGAGASSTPSTSWVVSPRPIYPTFEAAAALKMSRPWRCRDPKHATAAAPRLSKGSKEVWSSPCAILVASARRRGSRAPRSMKKRHDFVFARVRLPLERAVFPPRVRIRRRHARPELELRRRVRIRTSLAEAARSSFLDRHAHLRSSLTIRVRRSFYYTSNTSVKLPRRRPQTCPPAAPSRRPVAVVLLVEGLRRVAAVARPRAAKSWRCAFAGSASKPAASHFEWARSRRPAPPGWAGASAAGRPAATAAAGTAGREAPRRHATCVERRSSTPSTRPRHNFYTESRTRHAARRELLGRKPGGGPVREALGRHALGREASRRALPGVGTPELLRRLLRRLRGKARHFLVRLGLRRRRPRPRRAFCSARSNAARLSSRVRLMTARLLKSTSKASASSHCLRPL